MQCYTELTPPTAVTHSVTLQLVPGQGVNLAVAKASLLQIFKTKVVSAEIDAPATLNGTNTTKASTAGRYDSRLVNDDDGFEASFLGGDNIAARADRANSAKLVLVAEVTLPGTITGLARIKKPSGSSSGGADCLLLSFRDARLSLVEWNVDRNTLETISIHYYEKEELVGSPWVAPLHHYPTLLLADPASRCAALKFSERNLAILPFKQPDEDMDMDNWDEELDGPRPKKDLSGAIANGASTIEDTPYSPSFVLRLSKLEASLLHPVHLAFLHEYRDPTIGVLSSTKTASNSLGHRDHFTYMVFTLDLQQRASTTILAVNGLPQDLFRVVALPAPVGGALLVGANELIHIDQSGKSNGIAVNPLTKQTTSFSLVDQSDLDLRLEGCAIDVLAAELGEFLLILNDGRLGLITFRIDGRTVSGLSIKMLAPEAGGSVIQSRVTSLSRVGRSTVFVGSEEGDSVLLGWTRRQGQTQKRKSRIQDIDLDLDLDDEDLEDDDDDLYGEESTSPEQAISAAKAVKSGELNFRIHDRLLSIAPIQKMTYGQPVTLPDSEEERNSEGVRSDLQLVCAVGRGKASALAIMNLAIQPKIIGRFEFPEARGFWTVCAKKPIPKTLVGDKGPMSNDYDTSGQHHKFMIVAKVDLDGYETSDVYALTAAGFESLTGTEFEPAAGFTVEAGTMGKDCRILQVLKSEVRCYDGDLGLSQIVPMLDEETGAEPRVRTASIADPFLLLIRDDFSVFVAEMSPKLLELDEVEKEDQMLTGTKWLAGCLYTDTTGVFADEAAGKGTKDNILMFLLSTSGVLYIYRLPDLTKPVYVAEGLSYIPPGLSADYAARKGTAKESVAEILVADLGDTTHKSPYLILRHANDDLTLYQPYRVKATAGQPFSKSLFFQKVPNSTFAKAPEEKPVEDDELHNAQRFLPMRRCTNISGYSTVFLPGSSPSFILKTAKSSPRVLGLQGSGVQAMSSFHTEGCEHGFIYADTNGIARVTQIPTDSSFAELGLSVKKIPVGVDTQSVVYHPPTQAYVVGCNNAEPFELPKDDDYHKEWARENITFKPMVDRGMLKLLSGITWTVIDTVEMEPCETVLCVETLNLEVSESTNERKQLIAVGTALTKGEDLPTRGRVYVFDIADVIPEPGKPETSKKLKLVAKEDIPRGAVTALSEVGTQGLMLVAQGQKCMVRGLKEDGTLLPVAFMDMNCYVTSVKELPGTGLCLMADAFKGVWFTGYTEEPYKMMLFGKSSTRMEVLNADFLPDGKELYIVASDADGHIHILQFDPEHPKSLQGHLLLHRTTFNTGAHHPTSSLLLPAVYPTTTSPNSNSEVGENPPHILLLASPTGLLATLRPLQENAYRRLSSLAIQLTNALPHPAGLNPKGYRLPSPSASASMQLPGVDAGIGRNIVDGKILERFMELGTGKRQEIAGRAGYVVGTTNGGVNPAGSGKVTGNGGLSLVGLRNGLHGQEGGGMEWEEVRGELGGVLGWSGLGYF